VADAVGGGFQAVKQVGDLGDRGEVELAAQLDQGRATVGANLSGQLLGWELLAGRCGEVGHVGPFSLL
jgi:hypothetical protein